MLDTGVKKDQYTPEYGYFGAKREAELEYNYDNFWFIFNSLTFNSITIVFDREREGPRPRKAW